MRHDGYFNTFDKVTAKIGAFIEFSYYALVIFLATAPILFLIYAALFIRFE